jgi:RNA polymerase sigma-70 factor (sigma-E family)
VPPLLDDHGPTDLDLAGGPVDFEAYAHEHLPRLLAYAASLTGDRELAADVVQDAMVKAHGRWARIQETDRPHLYVRRMVTNEYLSWRRRWQVRHVVAAGDAVLHARASPVRDPSERVVDRDDAHRRLDSLPPRQRAVLVLRYYEGLDDGEIAVVLGTTASTVRSNAARALSALRLSAPTEETR